MILILTFLLSMNCFASETATGGPVVKRGGATVVAKQIKPELKSDRCPPGLAEWVNDDFSDKSTLGMIKYPSEAQSCLSTVKTYEDHIKAKDQKSSFNSSEKLSDYLVQKYKQISPNAQNVLNQCSSLGDGKSRVAKTRFYTAAARYEAYNSTLLDELASIDSLISSGSVVDKLDCNSSFPFPKVTQKCGEYNRVINGTCKQSEAERLDALVEKTRVAFDEIEELNTAYKNCVAAKKQDVCNQIKTVIDLKTNEFPWIDSKVFQDNISATKSNQIVNRHITTEKIKESLIADLKSRRKAFTKQYSQNLQDVRCLTYTTKDDGAPCSFEDVRTNLTQIPNLVEAPTESASTENSEFKNYVESEQCLIERGQDRADTKKIINGAFVDATLLAFTGGLSVAGRTIKLIKGISNASKLKNAALLESYFSGANLVPGLKQAFASCNQKSKNLLNFKDKPEVKKNSLCPDSKSAFEIAKEVQSSCVTDALLSSADVLPFVAGLKVFKQLTRNEKLAEFINTAKTPGKQNRDLNFASTLTMEERYKAAEAVIGRPLTESQKAALKKAHETGGYDFDPNSPITREKDQILKDAGFSTRESAQLRGNGIAGSWDETLRNSFVGQTASIPRSDGSTSKATISRVLKRDANGIPTRVEVAWSENGYDKFKDVNISDMKIDYVPGQKIFFKRSNGDYTQGTIFNTTTDPVTGKVKYNVYWDEGGGQGSKSVSADSVSHLPPKEPTGNKNSYEKESANQNNDFNNYQQPPPKAEPAVPQSSFDQAASVTPRANNRINYLSDRPEMVRIVESKGKINSLGQIQKFLNLSGNPSRDEIKMEVRRKIQKYNSDQNPDYSTVTKETSDALNDMLNIIKKSEREAGASP